MWTRRGSRRATTAQGSTRSSGPAPRPTRCACDLAAQLRAGGDLALEPGQACAVDVAEPDARGHLDARLRSGRGHAGEAALELDLAFDVSGALSTRIAGQGV